MSYVNGRGKLVSIRITRSSLQAAIDDGWDAGTAVLKYLEQEDAEVLPGSFISVLDIAGIVIPVFSGVRKTDTALIVGGEAKIAVISYRGMCRGIPRMAYEEIYGG